MADDARRPLLEIAPYHRSENDARDYVAKIAAKLGIRNFKTKLTTGRTFTIQTSGKPSIINPRNEVRQARLNGVLLALQSLFDNSDRLMPPPMSIGVDSASIKISMKIGTFETSIHGAGIHEAPVIAIADDVLFYRRQVVESSSGATLNVIARAYRTYLQVSISLIDAFIGHAAFSLAEFFPMQAASPHFQTLKSTAPLGERMDAWFELWERPPSTFRQTKCWSDFERLRQERNRYVHPAAPIYSLGIDEIVDVLNRCRDGVGGTLECFREAANLPPELSYIQRIKTAPIIKRAR
jgi:hypothetical protein